MQNNNLKDMANALRFLSLWQVESANSGHPGMPLGAADIVCVLFSKFIKFYAPDAKWQNRDRFVLSAGHASALLYSLFYLCGYPDIDIEDLKNFRQLKAKTAGHPEYGYLDAIEVTTGPLGQGFANAVGMAIAEKKLNNTFSSTLVDHYTYVLAGDGCLQEGISQEAMELAGHLKLAKLIAIYDSNQITIDGSTKIANSTNIRLRFEASGWNVFECDGHDCSQIESSLNTAKNSNNNKPSLVVCSTKIGLGSAKQGTADVHGSPLKATEIEEVAKNLDWKYGKFEVPQSILGQWRDLGVKCKAEYDNWHQNLSVSPLKTKFEEFMQMNFVKSESLINDYIKSQSELKQSNSTRQVGGDALNLLQSVHENIIIGSADLAKSNCVYTKHSVSIKPDDFSGNFLHYGIREHAMAAVMNGIYLHGGLLPIGSTFLVFADYLKPAIRLSALMEIGVVYVFTHDSVALGEDGPTHQPIEHLASLRMIPNLRVFRPSDQAEVAKCFQIALNSPKVPSAFAMSRQNLGYYRTSQNVEGIAKGAYFVFKSQDISNDKFRFFASGSEVALAIETAKELGGMGIKASVISVPCLELFTEQDDDYKAYVLGGKDAKRVFVEMANVMSFYKYIRADKDILCEIDTFGKSGPASKVMDYFGFTKEKILLKCMNS